MALTLLKRILKASEERGQQVDRAIYGIRIARTEEREPRFLTWKEVGELESWVPEYVSRIIPVAVLTMLRRGEILGLRDADVDFETGSIAVFSQRQDGQQVRTKTRAGRRTVDVGPQVLKLLREQQLARAPSESGYLFPTRSGAPFDGDNFLLAGLQARRLRSRDPRAHVPRPAAHGCLADDRGWLPRQGDRRADGPLGRRRAHPQALRPPLQGRSPASGNRPGIACFWNT